MVSVVPQIGRQDSTARRVEIDSGAKLSQPEDKELAFLFAGTMKLGEREFSAPAIFDRKEAAELEVAQSSRRSPLQRYEIIPAA